MHDGQLSMSCNKVNDLNPIGAITMRLAVITVVCYTTMSHQMFAFCCARLPQKFERET